VGDPRAHTDRGDLFDAQLHGDSVGRLESDTTDIAREPVGILGHYLDGVRAIGPEDTHCPGGTDPVTMQEHHNFPHGFLFGPGGENPGCADGPNPIDLAQALWRSLDDVEHFLAERTN